jgi:hypothetical protein
MIKHEVIDLVMLTGVVFDAIKSVPQIVIAGLNGGFALAGTNWRWLATSGSPLSYRRVAPTFRAESDIAAGYSRRSPYRIQ